MWAVSDSIKKILGWKYLFGYFRSFGTVSSQICEYRDEEGYLLSYDSE